MDTLFDSQTSENDGINTQAVQNFTDNPPLSSYIQTFLKEREKKSAAFNNPGTATIRVSEVLSSIAHLYERIRNIVEYKGEQVLRRNAIERMLKRLLWERSSRDPQNIAQVLIRELIWARYLPNDTIPKSKANEIGTVISKYLHLLGLLTHKGQPLAITQLRVWIWGIASCEIEEKLDPSARESYVTLMYRWFTSQFEWKSNELPQEEKHMQIYLAVHRALAKSDDHIMRYHLLLKEFPEWLNATEATVTAFTERFFMVYERIEKQLAYKDRFILYRLMQRQVAPFEILRDLVDAESVRTTQILKDPPLFEIKIRERCLVRYAQIQNKVRRGIIRSILYIFATKVLFALIIEVPYELFRFGHLIILPLVINTAVPPFMMFVIGLTIKTPDEANTQRILAKLKTIVYPHEVSPIIFSLNPVKRASMLANLFAFVYAGLFIVLFGGITFFLLKLEFTFVAVLIFFVFLSLVLLFGFRVRYTATQLTVTGSHEGILGYLFNNITLPFLSAGVYLSKGLSKINFITVILDFLIETPLKTVIEIVEEWTSFIREKQEEVVEVPQ